jgi:hypothetical protein
VETMARGGNSLSLGLRQLIAFEILQNSVRILPSMRKECKTETGAHCCNVEMAASVSISSVCMTKRGGGGETNTSEHQNTPSGMQVALLMHWIPGRQAVTTSSCKTMARFHKSAFS